MSAKIDFPSDAEMEAAKTKFLAQMKAMSLERRALIVPATEALNRLVMACGGKSGQAYHIRALLFSLWNGKPTGLLEKVNLDWSLQKDLCAVMLAFGHNEFFYDAIQFAFEQRNLFAWFKAEGEA